MSKFIKVAYWTNNSCFQFNQCKITYINIDMIYKIYIYEDTLGAYPTRFNFFEFNGQGDVTEPTVIISNLQEVFYLPEKLEFIEKEGFDIIESRFDIIDL